MEHRHHPRRLAQHSALLYDLHGFIYPGRVHNISFNGLYVKTAESRIKKGSYLKLAIDASPPLAKHITARAVVVHKEHDGIGLLIDEGFPLQDLLKDTK